MIDRLIAANFRRPTGVWGRITGRMMARNNDYECGWTVSLLDIQPQDQVLEIGFGPGVAIHYAAQKAVEGLVAGIDCSETMVQTARRRNAALSSRRLDLRHGEAATLPYQDNFFDRAFCVHCLYFWADPLVCLQELRRTLKPNGRVAVTLLPKENWPQWRMPPPDLFTLYNCDEAAELLSAAGFREVRAEPCPQSDQFSGVCILGRK